MIEEEKIEEEKNFEDFCKNRKWEIYKITELPNIKTPDFFVVANNQAFICEVKKLSKSGAERKDIVEFKDEIENNVEGVFLDYNKEIDSIVKKIDEAKSQFQTTSSFGLPNVLIIYSERLMPIDKDMLIEAAYGKHIPAAKWDKNKKKFIFKKKYTKFVDISLREDKNNLISAIAIVNRQKPSGMFVLYNLWAIVPLPLSVFNKKDDINYIPAEIVFKEIKRNNEV